eukprot:Sdes_comp10034_c0_seq1m1625
MNSLGDLAPVLFVGDGEVGDLNEEPLDASEYLRRVRLEANRIPDYFVSTRKSFPPKRAENVVSHSLKIISPSFNSDFKLSQFPAYLPSREWYQTVFLNFHSDRKIAQEYFLSLENCLPVLEEEDSIGGQRSRNLVENPKIWFDYCFEQNSETGEKSLKNPPCLEFLGNLAGNSIYKLAKRHISWLLSKESEIRREFSEAEAVWLYSLLVCLDFPTNDELIFSLRSVFRNFSSRMREIFEMTKNISRKDEKFFPQIPRL